MLRTIFIPEPFPEEIPDPTPEQVRKTAATYDLLFKELQNIIDAQGRIVAKAKSNIVKADTSTLVGWKSAHATHKSGPFFESKIGEHEWWKCPCGAKWPTTRSGI